MINPAIVVTDDNTLKMPEEFTKVEGMDVYEKSYDDKTGNINVSISDPVSIPDGSTIVTTFKSDVGYKTEYYSVELDEDGKEVLDSSSLIGDTLPKATGTYKVVVTINAKGNYSYTGNNIVIYFRINKLSQPEPVFTLVKGDNELEKEGDVYITSVTEKDVINGKLQEGLGIQGNVKYSVVKEEGEDDIVTIDENTGAITIVKGNNEKVVKIKATTISGLDYYEETEYEVLLKVKLGKIEAGMLKIKGATSSANYNEKPHGAFVLTAKIEGDKKSAVANKIYYSQEGKDDIIANKNVDESSERYKGGIEGPVNAGVYDVYADVPANDYFEAVTRVYVGKFTINPHKLEQNKTTVNVELYATDEKGNEVLGEMGKDNVLEYTYGTNISTRLEDISVVNPFDSGKVLNEKEVKIESKNIEYYKATYKDGNVTLGDKLENAPEDVGEYAVKVIVEGIGNYTNSIEKVLPFRIISASHDVPDIEVKKNGSTITSSENETVDGKDLPVYKLSMIDTLDIITKNAPKGNGKVKYSVLNGSSVQIDTVIKDDKEVNNFTLKNPGKTTVRVEFTGDPNYNDRYFDVIIDVELADGLRGDQFEIVKKETETDEYSGVEKEVSVKAKDGLTRFRRYYLYFL